MKPSWHGARYHVIFSPKRAADFSHKKGEVGKLGELFKKGSITCFCSVIFF